MLPKQVFYHAFNVLDGIGFVRLNRLLAKTYGDIERAWYEFPTLARICFGQDFADELIKRYRTIDVVAECEKVQRLGISWICLEQDSYPDLLKSIAQPPIILYWRGRLALPERCLTVVGTRKMSSYGRMCVYRLIPPLAAAKIGIVSGLAFGIDAATHEAALSAGMYTVAVLASGVDMITPPSNEQLANKILASGGCILSEMPPGFVPTEKGCFPRRNRILAGLTTQTLVIEAIEKSGSLSTAHLALEANREVAAVPGPINSGASAGCHKLLQEGARLITKAEDLLSFYNVSAKSPRTALLLTAEERAFARNLEGQPMTLDEIIEKTKLSASQALVWLTTLELKGAISQVPGRGYQLDVTLDDNE